MIELEKKYRENRINREQLIELRQKINQMDDQLLEQQLNERWQSDQLCDVLPSKECFDAIRSKTIDDTSNNMDSSRLNQNNHFLHIKRNLFNIAAAMLIIILGYTTIHYRQKAVVVAMQQTVISTGDGEKVSISLPDGTSVMLNNNSQLTFLPTSFGKGSREIQFEGEGYFEVTKDSENPFIINCNEVDIKVLGTTFNLNSRLKNNTINLDLTEGRVLFMDKTNQYDIDSNHKIIYDKDSRTGVVSQLTSSYKTEWMQKKIKFKSADLKMILGVLNENFNVNIELHGNVSNADELFSGTLSNSSLQESIEIIESVYNLESAIVGKKVILRSKQY